MAYADDFKIWGPYKKENGRQIVIVVDHNGKKRTVSYPKWIMECQLGRQLDPDKETVDHYDSNFDNNNLDNLRIVERSQHSGDDTRRVKLVKFHCAWCDKEFERSPRLIRDKAKKNKAGPFCSRGCAGKYSRKLQLKLIDKFDSQKAIDSEYYKRKYVTASAYIDVNDIFIDYYCDIWE
jgi:HNH endonuclease